jgi:hypothetical protein
MKRLILAIALVFGITSVASAQTIEDITVRPHLGVYTPAHPLVFVGDGYSPHVELAAGPTVGLELDMSFYRPWLGAYAGLSGAFSRLHHSDVMELRDVDGHFSSRASLLLSTLGLLLSPDIGMPAFQPSVRLGLGSKSYFFDLYDVNNAVSAFTGDFGLGFTTGTGPVTFRAEGRWMPSSFQANMLPIRAYGNEGQMQNDWFFQTGFQFQPFVR